MATTRRENMLRVFRHEEPEWVPITTICDNYSRPIDMPDGILDSNEGVSATLALARYFDIDIWDRCNAYTENYRNVDYRNTTEGSVRTQQWETPYGVITSRHKAVRSRNPSGEEDRVTSWAPCEWPIKSSKDFKAFAHIAENTEYEFHPDEVAKRSLELGDRGILALSAPSSPLGMCVRAYMGVETLGFAYYDHPNEFRDLLELIADKYYEAYRGIAQTSGDAAINYDDTTTFAISPTMFRELEVPYLNKTADIMHAQDKFLIHHACGHVLALLDDLRGTRVDVLDGPYAPPAGDTTVAQAREKLGFDIVISPPTDDLTVQIGDPEAIREYVRSMFQQAESPRNLIVDVVPQPGAPVANLWLAIDEAKKWSRQFPGAWRTHS